MKHKVDELISNIHQCCTSDGVSKIEQHYKQKIKDLGDMITPIMRIRIEDAIAGRRNTLDSNDVEKQNMIRDKEEQETQDKIDAENEKVDAKVNEGLFFVTESEFFNTDVKLDETSIDAACILDIDMAVPTKGHTELFDMLDEAAARVGSTAKVYIDNVVSRDINRIAIAESISASSIEVQHKPYMISEVEKLMEKGIYRIFAFVEEKKVPEYTRVGRHFLKEGLRFEIITYKNKIQPSKMFEYLNDDDFDSFIENSPLGVNDTEKLYDTLMEDMFGRYDADA